MDSICDFCNSIPFERLPSEEELAYPHQPSLAALQTSATRCLLCQMILEAIGDVRRSIDNEARGVPEDRCVMFYPGTDHTGARERTYFGPVPPRDLNASVGLGRERLSLHTDYAGDVLRPWLYGNWWTLGDLSEGPYHLPQLIGIGVRLAKTPKIHDAEGNSNKMVTYRGSGLRIRTDDGRLTSPRILLG
jgi:hypothetical protein